MRRFAAVMIVLLMLVVMPVPSDADGTDMMLFDMGNGSVSWSPLGDGTVRSATLSSAIFAGLDISFEGDVPSSIGGMAEHSVGGQTCGWILYEWHDGWVPSSLSATDTCPGVHLAWGFYPSPEIVPASTPEHRSSWTSFRGDVSGSGCSDSHGPETAAYPVEWYSSYTTGSVDCTVVAAGGLLYHTTGGVFGSSGEKLVPWIYCISAEDGSMVWKYRLSYGVGYEVTTPVIVGDMLLVTTTDGTLYCFDRYGNGTEEGVLLHSTTIEAQYPMDGEGNIVWTGRTFMTGAASPIYDSGAIYFGHSDGRIFCYSMDRTSFTLLWTYTPTSTVEAGVYTGERGCFYYHSPTIADVDFGGYTKRVLFIGSYEGYAYAIDASTGDRLWTERMINLGDDNIPHRGTPGSVATIVPIPGGRLLISCNDGGMSSMTGYTICVDAATGTETFWKLDVILTQPTLSSDGFSCYVSSSVGGQNSLATVSGGEIPVASVICRFDYNGKVVWSSHDASGDDKEYPLIKAPLTSAAGVLYAVDYSAGTLYPSGGCVHAIDEGTGEHIWSIRLTPYSSSSYSMSMATVLDGKVIVANDYGAVYCISDTPGKEYDGGGEKEIINDLGHWSWFLLIGITAVATFIFIRKYR